MDGLSLSFESGFSCLGVLVAFDFPSASVNTGSPQGEAKTVPGCTAVDVLGVAAVGVAASGWADAPLFLFPVRCERLASLEHVALHRPWCCRTGRSEPHPWCAGGSSVPAVLALASHGVQGWKAALR